MLEYYQHETQELLQENQQLRNQNRELQLMCATLIQETVDFFATNFPSIPKYDEEDLAQASRAIIGYYNKQIEVVKKCIENTLSAIIKSVKEDINSLEHNINKQQGEYEDKIHVQTLDRWTNQLEILVLSTHQRLRQIVTDRSQELRNCLQLSIPALETRISQLQLQITKLTSKLTDSGLQIAQLQQNRQIQENQCKRLQMKLMRKNSEYELLQQDHKILRQEMNASLLLNQKLKNRFFGDDHE